MSIDEKTVVALRSALLVAAEALNAVALAVEALPTRDELLLTMLACAHVRAGGTAVGGSMLGELYELVVRITDLCRSDLGDVARRETEETE